MLAHELGSMILLLGPIGAYLVFLERRDRASRKFVDDWNAQGHRDSAGNIRYLDYMRLSKKELVVRWIVGLAIFFAGGWLSVQ